MPSARHGYFGGLARFHERLSFKLVVLLESSIQSLNLSSSVRHGISGAYHPHGDLTGTLLLVFLLSNTVHTTVQPQSRPRFSIGCFRHPADDAPLKPSNFVQAADEREPIALPEQAVAWRS